MNKLYFDEKGKLSLVLDNVKLQDNLVNNIDLSTIDKLEIDKGTDIILDVISMHRDKEVWGNDADVFKPER